MSNLTKSIIAIGLIFALGSCEDYLKESPPGELAPDNFLATKTGVESVLFAAYNDYKQGYGHHELLEEQECTADILYQTGGGMNIKATVLMEFQWTASNTPCNWGQYYSGIRNANIVLENINQLADATDAEKKLFIAEARFIRAVSYIKLLDDVGGVPIRTSTLDDPEMARNTIDEVKTFIETEMNELVADLPTPGSEPMFGRATKGAAYGFLARHYLNTKQWALAASTAKQVMDLNYYELWPNYRTLFNTENEHDKNPANKEMVAVAVMTHLEPLGQKLMACAMPANFLTSAKLPEYVFNSGMRNWASHFRLRDAFVDSFDKINDTRFSLIIENYINLSNVTVNLRTQKDNARSMKFFDPNAMLASHGNDVPWIRYADILLMRAEALNEVNGPTQESLDLLNMVRNRAGLVDMTLGDFASKEELRDHIILKERGWEFYSEWMRWRDLKRHGTAISGAVARGKNAQAHHVLWPIPQSEMDTNPNMVQNEGY